MKHHVVKKTKKQNKTQKTQQIGTVDQVPKQATDQRS